MSETVQEDALRDIARQIIDLKATDMLVLRMPWIMSDASVEQHRRVLRDLVPEAHRDRVSVVVLSRGMTLAALSLDQLAALGYMRVERG